MELDLIKVWQDTISISESYCLNKSNTIKYGTKDIIVPDKTNNITKNVLVQNTDSVSAIVEWSGKGKTAVLNMASHKRPGGGVRKGSKAQEECLFRCSNLGINVSDSYYPLGEFDLLYTENIYFFKDRYYNLMSEVLCDVITLPAFNLKNYIPENYVELTEEKIKLILSSAIKNNVKNLILGAFGCGVFDNKPKIMSRLFYNVIYNYEYSKYFDNIVFAIINDHNSKGDNYDEFYKMFNK